MSTNSVYQIVGLYIDDKVFSLENKFQPHDYFGTTEDIAVFNLNKTVDADIRSGLREVEMSDNLINKGIATICIVNENKKFTCNHSLSTT